MIICLLSITLLVNASKVDTLDVYSNSMNKYIRTCVVTPENYNEAGESYPVLYLLTGYSGNYSSWVAGLQIKDLADQYNIIMVSPDPGYSSWYFDSPIDSTMRYETFVTSELIKFIDNEYNTIKSRDGRAVMGLSMGGHGALYLSMRHQDIFGAAGSMSGGVDIRPFPNSWDLAKRLGKKEIYPDNWEKNTVFAQLYLVTSNSLAIIIDCGTEDFFIDANRRLHKEMLYLNIEHDYIERPGGHNAKYWLNSIPYQVLFFDNFFRRE